MTTPGTSRSLSRDRVRACRAVHVHGVDRTIAATAAGAEVDVDLGKVGAGHVVDGDIVGAAQCAEIDRLGAVHIHRDVANVTGEANAPAVRRDVDFLGDVRTVELQRIGPRLALDHIAAVAGIPDERIVVGAEERYIVTAPAGDRIVAVAAQQMVGALTADDQIVAGSAVNRELEKSGGKSGRIDHVVAVEPVDGQIVGSLGVGDVDIRGEAIDADDPTSRCDRDRVRACRAVHVHGVDRTIAATAAGAEVDVDLGKVGAGHVVDGDIVGAAQCAEIDRLGAVHIHRDVANVARKAHAPTVRRDVDFLGDVRTVELQRIGPRLALDHIAAVAGIPDERIVVGAEQRHVVAAPAGDRIVAVAAQQMVGALAADDRIVAGSAVDRELEKSGGKSGRIDHVVAVEPVDGQIVGSLGVGDVDIRGEAIDADDPTSRCDRDRVRACRAVHVHGVDRTIAATAAGAEVDVDLGKVGAGHVVDGDIVGAAQCAEIDRLGAVHIHRDVANVARKAHAPTVRRDVDFLGDVRTVELQRIGPRLALDHIAAVAGIPDERIVVGAEERRVSASSAGDCVVSLTANKQIVAGSTVNRELEKSGGKSGRIDHVVAVEPVDGQIVGSLGVGDVDIRGEAIDADDPTSRCDRDRVRACRAVHVHGVDRTIAATAAGAEVDVDLGKVGAGHVVDGDIVGAAQCAEIDRLGAVHIHRDVANVARKAHAPTVRRDVDFLGDVRTVELQRIGPRLALDHIAAVAGIPDERIVVGAEERYIVTAPAGDRIVAVAAQQMVGALAADDRIVAGSAVDRELEKSGGKSGRIDHVVAVEPVDGQIVGSLGVGDVDIRGEAIDADDPTSRCDRDRVRACRAVHVHGVDRTIAATAAGAEVDVDLGKVGAGHVVDGDIVGAAQCAEIDRLGAVHIHRDVANVARKAHAPTVRRDVDFLGDVRTVELQRIGPRLALDHIAAVAGIPDERIVVGAEQRYIVTAPAGDRIVAVAAQQMVVAIVAGDLVVAGTAGEGVILGAAHYRGGRQSSVGFVERDGVFAGIALHLDEIGVGNRGGAALNDDGAVVDQDRTGEIAADRDRIRADVPGYREHAGYGIEGGENGHGR